MKKESREIFRNLAKDAVKSDLSSIGAVVNKLMQIIRDPDSSASELRNLIEIDPPLCSKVLKRANSASFGLQREVLSIQDAIVLVGFNTIKNMALELKVGSFFSLGDDIHCYSRRKLWKHSMAVAMCSRYIYRCEFRERGDDAYSVALLHDIGVLVFEEFRNDTFRAIIQRMCDGDVDMINSESAVLGFDHAMMGGELASMWNLPRETVATMRYHHNPLSAPELFRRSAMTLYVADHACQLAGLGADRVSSFESNLYEKCLDVMKVRSKAVELIVEDVRVDIAELDGRGELYV